MVRVEITGMVITSTHGTLQAGDIVRTSQEFADHLVADCKAAKYLDVEPVGDTEATEQKSAKRGRRSA